MFTSRKYSHLIHTQIFLGVLVVLILLCIPLEVLGQIQDVKYVPLVGFPELGNAASGEGLGAYFNKLYLIAISIGALIAFVKISIAGVKWSFSDIVTDKSSAKKDIQGVLLGLTILLVPAIVLGTINPKLLSLDFLQNAQKLDTSKSLHKTTNANNTSGNGVGATNGGVLSGGSTTAQPGTTVWTRTSNGIQDYSRYTAECRNAGGIVGDYTDNDIDSTDYLEGTITCTIQVNTASTGKTEYGVTREQCSKAEGRWSSTWKFGQVYTCIVDNSDYIPSTTPQ